MRALLAAGLVLGMASPAWAEDARPAGHPASESSVPSAAPAAGTKTVTGSEEQGAVVKEMNAAEKAKVEKTGK